MCKSLSVVLRGQVNFLPCKIYVYTRETVRICIASTVKVTSFKPICEAMLLSHIEKKISINTHITCIYLKIESDYMVDYAVFEVALLKCA